MAEKEYLNRRQVADILGVSRPTIYRHVKRGIFPEPDLQIPPNTVRWSRDLVESWIRANPRLCQTMKAGFSQAEQIRETMTQETPHGTIRLVEQDHPDKDLIDGTTDSDAKWTDDAEMLKEILKQFLGLPASTSDKVLLARTAHFLDAVAKLKNLLSESDKKE